MAQIEVKFDHQLKQSPIVIPLELPGENEANDADKNYMTGGQVRQTSVYGTRVPLIKVNDIVVGMENVLYMMLDGNGPIPKLTVTVHDEQQLIRGLQAPGLDNELRLQIIPRFDNAYRKVDLTFYIEKCDDDNGDLTLTCRYKIPDLYNSRVECFGEASTYELCEKIATNCSLGFATNVEASEDKRYIYGANESYVDILNKAILSSGTGELDSKVMYDWWVDFWNSINFVDVYERYSAVDSDDDMMVYVSTGYGQNIMQSNEDEQAYIKVKASITNSPAAQDSELYVPEYGIKNKSTMVREGSDRVISIYGEEDRTSDDYLLQDGDQKRDIFVKYEYGGEYYGEYDYLLAKECRRMMKDKMESEVIEVTVNSPLISLMRGSKVYFEWYDTNAKLEEKKKILGIDDTAIESNVEIATQDDDTPGPQFKINRQVSGQYYVLGSKITFEDNVWSNTLRLIRPRSGKQQLLDLYEETKNLDTETTK